MSAEELVQVAKVLKSNGTSGDILLSFRDFDPSDIDIKEPVFIFFDGLPVPFFFTSFDQKNSSRVLAHLMDVDCLRDAEEIVGQAVYADASLFEESCQDGEGLDSFVGMRIADPVGIILGKVSGFEDIPGNPCLYLDRGEGGEVLIPLHEDFILKVEGDTITMQLPEGVL